MFKKLFASAILFLVLSCASTAPEQLSSLPSWYVAPKAFDNQNLYGVGEGYTLAEASKSALNNLASKLMTSISSESSILLESNKYATNEQSRQQINEVVAKITFNNYRVNNSAGFGGKIYVEIAVDRDIFVADYNQKLSGLDQKMADIFKQAQSKTILEKFNDFEQVNALSIEAQTIARILSGLSANQNLRQNDLYNSYQNAYQNLASKMEFFIDNKNAPQPLVSAVIKSLNNKNLKVINHKNLNNSNLVIVQIDAQIVEQQIYGSNIAKLKVNFSLLSNQNKIIKSSLLESSGSSVISKKEAINAAIAGASLQNLF